MEERIGFLLFMIGASMADSIGIGMVFAITFIVIGISLMWGGYFKNEKNKSGDSSNTVDVSKYNNDKSRRNNKSI